jgi:tetratricopeptide (TPR) repeat protein
VVALPALAALSILTSANRGATVIAFAGLASYTAVLWLCADSASRGGAGRVLGALLLGALIAGGMGLQEWGLHARSGDTGWRAVGPFTNQNFFAGYLVPPLLVAFGLSFRVPEAFRTSTWMLALGILTAALTGAVMVSGSRGGLVALGAGLAALAVLGIARGPLRSRESWGRLAVLLVVLGIVVTALFGAVRNRLAVMTGTGSLPPELCQQASQSQAGQSAAFRKKTWQASAAMGLKRPLLGWGAGSFDTAFAPHAIADYTRHAHSNYLQLLAELGLPGALVWVALLGCAVVPLLKGPKDWSWAPGVGAALVAGAVHGVFDSLLYVPAIALSTFGLLGLALRPSEELARRMDTAAAPAGRRRGASPGPRPMARLPRGVLLGIAAAGVALCVLLAFGRSMLESAQAELGQRQYAEAEEHLRTAQALLPWDHEVADTQRRVFLYQGKTEEAAAAAQRAINLAPERPPGYYFLGLIREEAQNNPVLALLQYEQGLKHAPNEVRLLMARARVAERLGERDMALESYRKVAAVEDSDVGKLRALNEVVNYRFARARMRLAQDAQSRGNADEAHAQRRRAACLLAERRTFFDAAPLMYRSDGDFNPGTERELRLQEAQLWSQLGEDFRARRDNRLAALAEEQAAKARESMEGLRALFEQFGPES